MPPSTIRIKHATGSLRQDALRFVQEQYFLSFGTTPGDEPTHLFVACADIDANVSEIVGTIGISIWEPIQSMRLARIYEFDWKTSPRPVLPETVFEYGRLIATRRGISKALIAAASQYALMIGRTCGWCEHTDAVHRVCMSFGLSFHVVQAHVRMEDVADGDTEYYRCNPSVHLYMTDTDRWVRTLADSVIYENEVWSIR